MFVATARSSRRCTIWNGEFSDRSSVLITPAEAAARARILASAADAAILATDLVERLDNGNPYFLVTVAELTGGGGIVVAIDAITGEVISSARLEHVERHRLPGRREAIAHAAYPDDAEAGASGRPPAPPVRHFIRCGSLKPEPAALMST